MNVNVPGVDGDRNDVSQLCNDLPHWQILLLCRLSLLLPTPNLSPACTTAQVLHLARQIIRGLKLPTFSNMFDTTLP